MDIQYTTTESKQDQQQKKTLYTILAGMLGVQRLQRIETALGYMLTLLIVAFLGLGVGVGIEAFFKATGKEFPENVDRWISSAEPFFTPLLVTFLALSSVYGLYKQSQLSSGVTAYAEDEKDK